MIIETAACTDPEERSRGDLKISAEILCDHRGWVDLNLQSKLTGYGRRPAAYPRIIDYRRRPSLIFKSGFTTICRSGIVDQTLQALPDFFTHTFRHGANRALEESGFRCHVPGVTCFHMGDGNHRAIKRIDPSADDGLKGGDDRAQWGNGVDPHVRVGSVTPSS